MPLTKSNRDAALDWLRGATIALMIVVNNPGSWANIYPVFKHAAWFGYTPTDLVFPFFLFVVGFSICYSQTNLVRIIRRSLIIFALGLFLNAWPLGLPLGEREPGSLYETFANLRIMGVLQRIALCYFFVSLCHHFLKRKMFLYWVMASLILLYEVSMRTFEPGGFTLTENNIRTLDLFIFGKSHMYTFGTTHFDPEGLLSSLGAMVTTLFGLTFALFIRQIPTLQKMLFSGGLLTLGHLFAFIEPISKPLYTISYALVGAGWAALTYSLLRLIREAWPNKDTFFFFTWLGKNSLLIFASASLFAKTLYLYQINEGLSIKTLIYQQLCLSWLSSLNASLFHALLHLSLWMCIAFVLFRKKIFIKV